MDLTIGARFTVKTAQEVKNGRGRILARFLPEHDYRITPANLEIVSKMAAEGVAEIGGNAARASAAKVAAGAARIKGRASTGKAAKPKG